MVSSLPPLSVLTTQSWRQFLKNWNHNFQITVWALPIPCLQFLLIWLIGSQHPSLSGDLLGILQIVQGFIALLITVRLTQTVLLQDNGQKDPSTMLLKPGEVSILLSFLWISFLTTTACFGGFILFLIPGIWLSLPLSFASLIFLETGTRGSGALAAAIALVRGRWWAAAWRVVIGNFLFSLVVALCYMIITFLLGLIAGANALNHLYAATNLFADPSSSSIAMQTLSSFVNNLLEAAFLPLFVTLQVKIFHALNEKRPSASRL